MHLTLHFVIITLFFITFFSYLKEKGDSFTKPSPVPDSSFPPPVAYREQKAYRGEYPVSWNPHFYCMAGNRIGETTWGIISLFYKRS